MLDNIGSFYESYQRIDKAYRKYFQKRLADYGFTPNEIVVILFLYNNAPRLDTATDIARRKGLSKGMIARSVESLYRKNYLETVRDQKDRRVVHLHLKDEHSQMAAELAQIQQEFFTGLEKDIPAADIRVTQNTLSKLLTNAESFLTRRESYAE